MEHNLFKPRSFEEGKHAVVGDCNGFSMQERWENETPEFAKRILELLPKKSIASSILDYGCGVGRLAKEVIKQSIDVRVIGTDASEQMMEEADRYVGSNNFCTSRIVDLPNLDKFDLVYCVYVLQHCPAIDLRDAIRNIYNSLKDDGYFVYCSSDYRMCIRFDGQGFFDDRFLGVNIREEIEKYFDVVEPLFNDEIYNNNPLLRKMITGYDGGLAHPAFIYKKKVNKLSQEKKDAYEHIEVLDAVKDVVIEAPETRVKLNNKKEYTKLVLVNRLAPGDILVMTNALRDLHKAYPGKYQVDVRTPCNEIFENNPYVNKFVYDEQEYNKILSKFHKLTQNDTAMEKHLGTIGDDVLVIDMQYPLIHSSHSRGSHFSEGHREFLEEVLNVKIPQTDLRPELYLTQSEKDWANPLVLKKGIRDKYWVINAGSKGDYTLKQYPYYQEVVNLLKDKIKLVQIGLKSHMHSTLDGTISMLGETNTRELMKLIYHAEGVISCVSFPMHIAAAFNKPCVVVAGAREGTRWELYSNHQFLYVNGCLPCASYDGCWKSTSKECINKVGDVSKCMTLITPEDVARAVTRYYDGGMLQY